MVLKRLTKCLVCLLICALLVPMLPAHAVTPVTPIVDYQEQPTGTSAGHQVSKVHRRASSSSTVIGSFENGTRITVLEEKGNYYKVDCFDMTGYIAKSQVRQDADGEYYVNCEAGSKETMELPSYSTQNALTLRSAILAEAHEHLGVRYLYGGITPRGFDCSGFTQYVFKQLEIAIPRTVDDQLSAGIIIAKEELQSGDLVIFSNTTGWGKFATHVGIYIGNDKVIHASASRGIAIDDLNSHYYSTHYECARRVLITDLAPGVSIPVTGLAGSDSAWR